MSDSSAVSLLVAALDLALVQDLVTAMRAVNAVEERDLQTRAAKPSAAAVRGDAVPCLRPDPRYERPRVIRSLPVYLPPRVIRAAPRCEPSPAAVDPEPQPTKRCEGHEHWPIKPVWAEPAWERKTVLPAPIKIIRCITDIQTKGTLLDTFL